MRRLAALCLAAVLVAGLAGVLAVLVTQYLFQEPAPQTWSRYLLPEFLWQRQKYPSARWVFDLVEPLVRQPDPQLSFAAVEGAAPLESATWNSELAGPRPEGLPAVLPSTARVVPVASARALVVALRAAQPGSVIELQPGTYDFDGTNLVAEAAGAPGRPIVVRAARLGSVRLRFALLEGFHVLAPHWVFENLLVEGTCRDDTRCEHAFHVVGAAAGVVIRNNWVVDFNAAVKVNGKNGAFPDNGTIEHNAFVNRRPRNTDKPVTLLDFVSASGWRVRKNLIADFAKNGGNHTSYGAFFKGAGADNLFEQNVVRCEWTHSGGARIGFSFGDGGSGRRFCRDGQCAVEHSGGIARNNLIMDCPTGAGIYLYKSANTTLHNNALINTRGIDLRHPATHARIVNNVIDGRVRAYEGATYDASANLVDVLQAALLRDVSRGVYADPPSGDLRLKDLAALAGHGVDVGAELRDLCGQPYDADPPDIGPIQYRSGPACPARLE